MIYFRKIFCWARGIWRTVRRGTWLYNNTVSGHALVEIEPEGKPDHIQILECSSCAHLSIAWWAK